jgi:hypothetical protein
MRRTETRTKAPILSSRSRMVVACAVANSVAFRPSLLNPHTSRYATAEKYSVLVQT